MVVACTRVQVPNAYETREDLVSHSAVPRTTIQPPLPIPRREKNSSSPMELLPGGTIGGTCRTISSSE